MIEKRIQYSQTQLKWGNERFNHTVCVYRSGVTIEDRCGGCYDSVSIGWRQVAELISLLGAALEAHLAGDVDREVYTAKELEAVRKERERGDA